MVPPKSKIAAGNFKFFFVFWPQKNEAQPPGGGWANDDREPFPYPPCAGLASTGRGRRFQIRPVLPTRRSATR